MTEYDAVIAGGGLSGGLSLAAHLAAGGWRDRSVLVVDDGGAHSAACWGSWTAAPALLDAAVSRTYRRIDVHAAGASGRLPLGRTATRSCAGPT